MAIAAVLHSAHLTIQSITLTRNSTAELLWAEVCQLPLLARHATINSETPIMSCAEAASSFEQLCGSVLDLAKAMLITSPHQVY